MTLTLFIIPLIALLTTLMMIYILLSYPAPEETETMTPFECGLDHISSARTPFSVRFFLLAVVFLVFDIETALLLPLPIIDLKSTSSLLGVFLFILVLIAGLAHEWRESTLEWSK